jgi:polysaccharide export outer membrane protein
MGMKTMRKKMSSMAKPFAFAIAVSALLLLQASVGLAQQSATPAPEAAPALRVGPGDLIEIGMYDNPDLSGRFRVDEKGDIAVPLLGLVHVDGETAEEVGKNVEQRYVDGDILKPGKAHATVFIVEYASQGITVVGQVKSAGLYPALGVRMLNDVMAAAGGVTLAASSNIIITRKSDPDHPITVEYVPEALTPVIPKIQIFPGDTIMVPRAGVVYVLGRVTRPGAYVLDGRQTLTVERAMALAGSSGPAAAMNTAHLVRTLADGRKEDILLNVNKIQEAKAPDVAMKDGDILFIPQSNTKIVLLQAINSALGIGTSIAVYRIGLNP